MTSKYIITIAIVWLFVGLIWGWILGWVIIGDCDPLVPDSQVIAYHLVGKITLESDSLDRADFNGDGVVNGLDLLLTLRGEE